MSVVEFDHMLFRLINQEWTNPFLDAFFPFLTNLNKVPAFLIFLGLSVLYFLWKAPRLSLKFLCYFSLVVGTTDMVNYRIIKPHFKRARPEFVLDHVELRQHSIKDYSFPSNHAANTFAGATLLTLFFRFLAPLFFAVAVLVAYSRIYVGVHFPIDVTVGAIEGIFWALLIFRLLEDWLLPFVKIQLRRRRENNLKEGRL
jgi:undecaprenyl-diphosphatase